MPPIAGGEQKDGPRAALRERTAHTAPDETPASGIGRSSTNTRVNEIDLLRFVAALAVVFYHYAFRGYAADGMSVMPYPLLAPFSKYGYLGVELFFMISGFVILMTAAGGSLRRFVVSRLVRLYPAFWACCTITFVTILAIGASRYSASTIQYLVNMTMLSEFVDVESIDGVYWSLFVELRFYALIAAILLIGKIHQAQWLMLAWVLASIALEILPIGPMRYLLIVDYSAWFIAGATCFLIWSKGISATTIGILALSCGLAMFQAVAGLDGFEQHFNTRMSRYTVAGIVLVFFLVMLLVSLRRTGMVGRNRWLLAGALTYPLYLLHQRIGFMLFNAAYPALNPHLVFWGVVALVLALAYAVHVFIEKPFSLPLKAVLNRIVDRVRAVRDALRESRSGQALGAVPVAAEARSGPPSDGMSAQAGGPPRPPFE